jgi:signal peptidase I
MEKQQLIINGIFYFFLTAFFIYIFINEKKLVKKIKFYREKFSDFIIIKLKVKSNFIEKCIRKFINFIEAITTALILVLLIQRFYLGNFLVPTGSMIPTIMPKDRLFGNMIIYKFRQPKREEIIVFKEPIQNKVLYTKRVMGLPGEEVFIRDGYLYVNNNKITARSYSDLGEIANSTWIIPQKGDNIELFLK